jgi:hypothetical protein
MNARSTSSRTPSCSCARLARSSAMGHPEYSGWQGGRPQLEHRRPVLRVHQDGEVDVVGTRVQLTASRSPIEPRVPASEKFQPSVQACTTVVSPSINADDLGANRLRALRRRRPAGRPPTRHGFESQVQVKTRACGASVAMYTPPSVLLARLSARALQPTRLPRSPRNVIVWLRRGRSVERRWLIRALRL